MNLFFFSFYSLYTPMIQMLTIPFVRNILIMLFYLDNDWVSSSWLDTLSSLLSSNLVHTSIFWGHIIIISSSSHAYIYQETKRILLPIMPPILAGHFLQSLSFLVYASNLDKIDPNHFLKYRRICLIKTKGCSLPTLGFVLGILIMMQFIQDVLDDSSSHQEWV